jgi:hypothetical protein
VKVSVGQVVGILAVGEVEALDVVVVEFALEGQCCLAACGVAIEHEQQGGSQAEESALLAGSLCSEERHCGHGDLSEAHDAPGALDDDEGAGGEGTDLVEAVEDLSCGQACWELPFAEQARLLGIEASACVTEGVAVGIVEADAEAALEEAAAVILAGLEEAGGAGADALSDDGVCGVIEGHSAGERAEVELEFVGRTRAVGCEVRAGESIHVSGHVGEG